MLFLRVPYYIWRCASLRRGVPGAGVASWRCAVRTFQANPDGQEHGQAFQGGGAVALEEKLSGCVLGL